MIVMFTKHKTHSAIFIIWLFHLSALIGIALGHQDWFAAKTPLNLSISLLLFTLVYPLNSWKKYSVFGLFFCGGMFAEWLGVNFSLLFGSYTYGSNFGLKIDGVPLLIGAYWAILTFISASIASYFTGKAWFKIILATLLMVLLDFLMEQSAAILDFWTFEGGLALFKNYITWFFLGLLFQILLHASKIKGDILFSLNLYLAQFVFFAFIYLWML